MDAPVFLSVANIITIHTRVIEEFGGDEGLRDRGLLESAAAMPQAMFSGQHLHSTIFEMAAAYHFHLCSNHPFVDGNKRVAVASAELFLILNGYGLIATDDELEVLTLDLAAGKISKDDVTEFYSEKVVESE